MKRLLALLLALMLLATPAFTASAEDSIYGTWIFEVLYDESTNVSYSPVDMGYEIAVAINEDGTADVWINEDGTEQSGSTVWTQSDNVISVAGLSMDLVIAENGLRWPVNDTAYFLFTKESASGDPAAIPSEAETSEADNFGITAESYVGYWSATGILVDGEVVSPTAFSRLVLKISLEGDGENWVPRFEAFQDDGEKWLRGEYIEWEESLAYFTQLQFHNAEQVSLDWVLYPDDTIWLTCTATSGAFEHNIMFERTEPWAVENPVGVWENVGFWNDGGNSDTYFAGKQMGTFTLNEDGTVSHEEFGSGTWQQANGEIILDFGGGNVITYYVSGKASETPMIEFRPDEYRTYIYELH